MTLDLDIAALVTVYSDGVRIGWTDGKLYCQGYTIGEEFVLADEAAADKGLSGAARQYWEAGYHYGYRRAAAGETLGPEHTRAPE
jgi:hypothetical protein